MANPEKPEKAGFDPESYRMTLGEHLEDLRRRLFMGLIGLVIATLGCLALGERVVVFFCKPLTDGLRAAGQNPQLHFTELTAPFMLYLKVSLIVAAAISGPWILYQFWQFIAAGLYPSERKTITRYIPLSVLLLVSGMVLAFFVVMPITVKFLLAFASNYPIPGVTTAPSVTPTAAQVMVLPTFPGDPTNAVDGQIWRNSHDGLIKIFVGGKKMALQFSSDQLLAQSVTIDDYVSLTIVTLLVFGLAFQLPLVVLAVYTVGIIDVPMLKRSRKIVYFALSIIAAVIAPGDVVSAMMALYIPLILLYELGILLCVWAGRKRKAEELA